MLTAPDSKRVATAPPIRPAAGSIYIFPSSLGKDFRRCDQYQWYNDGARQIPKADQVVKKHYFYLKTGKGSKTSEFRKHEYQMLSPPDSGQRCYMLVHYIGDHSVAGTNAPHGNAVKHQLPYVRTSAAVKNDVAAKGADARPAKIYRKLVATPGTSPAAELVLKPRNLEQVRNFQKAARLSSRVGHDSLYNCIELANQFPDYVRFIQVVPDLIIHSVNQKLLEEMHKAIRTSRVHSLELMEFQYDTTFKLGDFYLSCLSFRHSVFKGRPVVSVAFMLHERKFKNDHIRFIEQLKEASPIFGKAKGCLVTDCEFDFRSVLPEMVHVHCWNHIKKDLRQMLRNNMASRDEIRVYSDQIIELLSCGKENEFLDLHKRLKVQWSSLFDSYFEDFLKPRIMNHSGRWLIEPTGLFIPDTGITTNASESMNRVVHDLIDWKETPVDGLLISLKFVQGYYQKEISRGMHGLGTFIIRDGLTALRQPAELMPREEDFITPTEIVSFVQTGISRQQEAETKEKQENIARNHNRAAQVALARECVECRKVIFVTQSKAFMVEGSGGSKYAVTLFPKESCQCPSLGNCYHIMAAKMCMGIPVSVQKKVINLSVLKKKRLRRGAKTSGRKKPRMHDYEVEPAPNSVSRSQEPDKPDDVADINNSGAATDRTDAFNPVISEGDYVVLRQHDDERNDDSPVYEVIMLSDNSKCFMLRKCKTWYVQRKKFPLAGLRKATAAEQSKRKAETFSKVQTKEKTASVAKEIEYLHAHRSKAHIFKLPSTIWQAKAASAVGITVQKSFPPTSDTTILSPPAKLEHIKGDGNCFFRAISYCISGVQENHDQVRKALVQFMGSTDVHRKLEDVTGRKSYLSSSQLAEPGTWATQNELLAMAALLQTPIFCYTPVPLEDGTKISVWCWYPPTVFGKQSDNGECDPQAIYLNNTSGDHFDVVTNV